MRLARATSKQRLADIADLDEECFPDDDRMGYNEMVHSGWFVILDDGCVVAYLGMKIDGMGLFIHRVGVSSEYRGQRLHQRLLKAALRRGKVKGYTRFQTYLAYDNLPSLRSFLACGFKPVSAQDGFITLERKLP